MAFVKATGNCAATPQLGCLIRVRFTAFRLYPLAKQIQIGKRDHGYSASHFFYGHGNRHQTWPEPVPLRAFPSRAHAEEWQGNLLDYHISPPDLPAGGVDADWKEYDAQLKAWRDAHPVGVAVPSGDPFSAAVSATRMPMLMTDPRLKRIPDETTILNFRRLREKHELATGILGVIND